jgi:hypothetical protein
MGKERRAARERGKGGGEGYGVQGSLHVGQGKQEVALGDIQGLHAAAPCLSEEDKCKLCKKPPRQRRFLGGFSNCEYSAIFVDRNFF